jgi:hypothetical protein
MLFLPIFHSHYSFYVTLPWKKNIFFLQNTKCSDCFLDFYIPISCPSRKWFYFVFDTTRRWLFRVCRYKSLGETQRHEKYWTQDTNRKTNIKSPTEKAKKMSKKYHTKKEGWSLVLAKKCKQFLSRVRHLSC